MRDLPFLGGALLDLAVWFSLWWFFYRLLGKLIAAKPNHS